MLWLQIIFLILASFKGIYTLTVAYLHLKSFLNKTFSIKLQSNVVDRRGKEEKLLGANATSSYKLEELTNNTLSAFTTYHGFLAFIELIATGLMLIPWFFKINIQDVKYFQLGFLIGFLTGAVEDFTKYITYRWELRRRKRK